MDYSQALDYLFSLQKFGIKFGLSSTENLLAGLGDPHRDLPCLHLAGTNGKGSVGAMTAAMLTHAGYRVGFFTSPPSGFLQGTLCHRSGPDHSRGCGSSG